MGNFANESLPDSIVALIQTKNKVSDCEHDNNRTKLEKNKLTQRKEKKKFIFNHYFPDGVRCCHKPLRMRYFLGPAYRVRLKC